MSVSELVEQTRARVPAVKRRRAAVKAAKKRAENTAEQETSSQSEHAESVVENVIAERPAPLSAAFDETGNHTVGGDYRVES